MLRKICGFRKVLPATYELSRDLSPPTQPPSASGGFCDAYEGTLNVKVCIKRLKIAVTGDQEKIKEVSHSRNLLRNRGSLTNLEAVLQRGRGVETPESPKYCSFQGSHVRSPSTCLRMDARWRAATLCKGELGRGPHWSCGFVFTGFSAVPHPTLQSLGVAEGLAYLHSHGVIHGDLKGVRARLLIRTP